MTTFTSTPIQIVMAEYNDYGDFINHLQKHILKCYENRIITKDSFNKLFELLNTCLIKLNLTYNIYILENTLSPCVQSKSKDEGVGRITSSLSSSQYNFSTPLRSSIDKNNHSTNYEDTHNNINKINYSAQSLTQTSSDYCPQTDSVSCFRGLDLFEQVYTLIRNEICQKIGFATIKSGLTFLIGKNYKYLFYNASSLKKINTYNKILVPVKSTVVNVQPSNRLNKEIWIEPLKMSKVCNSSNACETVNVEEENLNNYFCLNLSVCSTRSFEGNKWGGIQLIKLICYFDYDYLNVIVRTAQLSNYFVHKKRKKIENYILNRVNIVENSFYRRYIKCIGIEDILTSSGENIYKKMIKDYELYSILLGQSFLEILAQFNSSLSTVKKTFNNMLRIIRVLLLGTSENHRMASILYNTMNNDYYITKQLYARLHYLLQIKLTTSHISIQNEINTFTNSVNTANTKPNDFKYQITLNKHMPSYVKQILFTKIEELSVSGADYTKQLLYIRSVLSFPWPSSRTNLGNTIFSSIKDRKQFISDLMLNLSNRVYGHFECKQYIREIVGKLLVGKHSTSISLGLCGPPGVGKTLLIKSLGETLGIPFIQISLGGQNDGSLLDGHNYTYVSSQPGLIITKLIQAKSLKCIVYFDELDKTTKRNDSNEIFNTLINITDPLTNNEFQDKFFPEIKFPLNEILFVFSYNNSEKIDKVLLDRFIEIEVKAFTPFDKIHIVRDFILKEYCTLLDFDPTQIVIKDEDIMYIIDNYTSEPGVRKLKKYFERIFLKLNIDRIYGQVDHVSSKLTIDLDRLTIVKYLGDSIQQIQNIHNENLVGVINGLYVSEDYIGGIIQIQVFNNYTTNDGRFMLVVTGNQKKIMRESVITAFNASINCIPKKILKSFISNYSNGLHVHILKGSVPKDGTSAGSAFAIAFISKILNKQIRNNIAITGEIDLTGNINKVGGLELKLIGAQKAGIKLVIISKQNMNDLINIKRDHEYLFHPGFQVIPIDNIRDALKYCLVDSID